MYFFRAMADSMPVLVAPDAFGGSLRAPVVAAAIARGLERGGVLPPAECCPVSGGGRGTIEVLLPVLGGETGDGFALVDGGGTALVELASTGRETGVRVVRAVAAGAEVVIVAAGGAAPQLDGGGAAEATHDGGAGVHAAIEDSGLGGATLVVLCDTRAAWRGDAALLPRDPRGVPMTAAGGGLAGLLWAHYGAQLIAGPAFVLEQLDFDARMRAARAVVIGAARLDGGTLAGRVAGEMAVRARQAGVPCHAVAGVDAIDRFDARILDLQAIVEADTVERLEAAGERLTRVL